MPKVKVARCGIPRLAELVGEHHPVLLLRTSVPPSVLGAVLSRLWVGSKQRETSTGSLWLGRRQRPLQLHGGQPPARQWLHPALLVDVNNGQIQTSHPGGHFTPIHPHSPFLSLSHSLTSYRLPFHALGGVKYLSLADSDMGLLRNLLRGYCPSRPFPFPRFLSPLPIILSICLHIHNARTLYSRADSKINI